MLRNVGSGEYLLFIQPCRISSDENPNLRFLVLDFLYYITNVDDLQLIGKPEDDPETLEVRESCDNYY